MSTQVLMQGRAEVSHSTYEQWSLARLGKTLRTTLQLDAKLSLPTCHDDVCYYNPLYTSGKTRRCERSEPSADYGKQSA